MYPSNINVSTLETFLLNPNYKKFLRSNAMFVFAFQKLF